jgi:hypothetical protein
MSDKELGKKLAEGMELDPFLDAYEWTTGTALSVLEASENSDFICVRANGEFIGVELTKVMRRGDIARWERILHHKGEMTRFDMLMKIQALIEKKEEARSARYSYRVGQTILVLQLVDGSLNGLMDLRAGLSIDIENQGFAEIWLADYSGIEPYGDIELFGLFPPKWRGYHQRSCPDRKPYG